MAISEGDNYFTNTGGNGSILFVSGAASTGSLLNVTAGGMTTGTAFTIANSGSGYWKMFDQKEYEKEKKFKKLGKLGEYNALKRLKQ